MLSLLSRHMRKARLNVERRTEQYVNQYNKGNLIIDHGDWVSLHMRKERFPNQRRSKLLPRGNGRFQVLQRINDNAYKLGIPGQFDVCVTFNVSDVSPSTTGQFNGILPSRFNFQLVR